MILTGSMGYVLTYSAEWETDSRWRAEANCPGHCEPQSKIYSILLQETQFGFNQVFYQYKI